MCKYVRVLALLWHFLKWKYLMWLERRVASHCLCITLSSHFLMPPNPGAGGVTHIMDTQQSSVLGLFPTCSHAQRYLLLPHHLLLPKPHGWSTLSHMPFTACSCTHLWHLLCYIFSNALRPISLLRRGCLATSYLFQLSCSPQRLYVMMLILTSRGVLLVKGRSHFGRSTR